MKNEIKVFFLMAIFICAIYLTGKFFNPEAFAENLSTQKEFFVINGGFNFNEQGTIYMYPLRTVIADKLYNPPEGDGPYALELYDAAGVLLKSYAFGTGEAMVHKIDGSIKTMDNGSFFFRIPYDERAGKLVIKKGPDVLWSLSKSANPPVISIKKPSEGEVLVNQKIDMEWAGSDSDGDVLLYYVDYSADEGFSWNPLLVDFSGTRAEMDRVRFSYLSSPKIIVSVACSDGFNTVRSVVNVNVGGVANRDL